MEKLSDLKAEIKELKARLAEAEETLDAIRTGAVDAVAVSGPDGDKIFTLQGAETPYRILVEEMNQGALMLSNDGTILYANSRFAELSKTPLEKVIGSPWQQFFPPDQSPLLDNYLTTTELIRPGGELNLRAADGSFCSVQLSLRPMSNNGVEGLSAIVTDLTERQESEQALRKISAELLEKNVELEAFSYSISHDMRTPLRGMQQYASVLLEDFGDTLDPVAKTYLDLIICSANRLDQLIKDVLAYSQLSSGKNDLATFDLDKMTREIVRSYPGLREADIEIVPSSANVRGYDVALGQCISNLLGNAIKFVPKGTTPHIKVWTKGSNGRMRLWVQDNGIGISTKDQGKIFNIFTRLHSNEDYEGTGIGLSMVKKAVEKMGGQVGVESELGKGSRFWIELARG